MNDVTPPSALLKPPHPVPGFCSGGFLVAEDAVHQPPCLRASSLHKRAAAAMLLLMAFCSPAAQPEDLRATDSEVQEPEITELDRTHWSWSPLRNVIPPAVSDPQGWVRNEIDQFILQRLQEHQLSPSPAASREVLIRRLTFDLTGLPPQPEEIADFLSDREPGAWERLVDRLLASPAYGERWAQHWLDLARFAETDGFEHDLIRPSAWRYRDWVIDSLNHDVPWDQFVQQQIAGDLLAPDDPSAAIPTGFLLCGPDMPDLNLMEERRHNVLNEMTSTVGSVFLGLQMGCAQCHNHMYDPVSQADFYRLRAFFESTEWTAEQPLERVSQAVVALDQNNKRQTAGMSRVVQQGQPRTAHLMIRGDFRRPGPVLQPAVPRIVGPLVSAPQVSAAAEQSRVSLGLWLTSPEHPLAARVIVNRIWQFHFGEGLVRTPSDFGAMGDVPSHSALLDWLAHEFPRRGWSFKQMHRLILTSAAWRQSSGRQELSRYRPAEEAPDPGRRAELAETIDPENRFLWRMNRVRLDGEAIRDAMLSVGGTLNRSGGGPGVRPPLPPELVATLLKKQWQVTADVSAHRRRSIYLFVRRNLRFPLFEAYDRPDTNASCPRRNRSTIAPQALVLLNSEQSLEAAQDFAGRILGESADRPADRIERAFVLALGRRPDDAELRSSEQFLAQQAERIAGEHSDAAPQALPTGYEPDAPVIPPADAAALTDLCLALFNLNEFIYID